MIRLQRQSHRSDWPETKARLLKDGEDADLSDLEPRRAKKGTTARRRALRAADSLSDDASAAANP